MSFRLFIYYCALCGGVGAFIGWALGRWLAGPSSVFNNGIKGLFLGLGIALLLGLLDALWNFSDHPVLPYRLSFASSGR